MLNKTHKRLWEDRQWLETVLYKTKRWKKMLKKQLPNGNWITIKD